MRGVDPPLRRDVAQNLSARLLGHEHDAQTHRLGNALDRRQTRIALTAFDFEKCCSEMLVLLGTASSFR